MDCVGFQLCINDCVLGLVHCSLFSWRWYKSNLSLMFSHSMHFKGEGFLIGGTSTYQICLSCCCI